MTILVAIGGVSGSGKSTGAGLILEYLRSADPGLRSEEISLDNFYIEGLHELIGTERDPRFCRELNYDHPDSIDKERLAASLDRMLSGETLSLPRYNFDTHRYHGDPIEIPGNLDVAVVESILALHLDEVFERADFKFYWNAPENVAFHRRFFRDIEDRGRTEGEVNRQMKATVFPMQREYVIPSQQRDGVLSIPWDDEQSRDEYMAAIHCCAELIYQKLIGKKLPRQSFDKFIIPGLD